MKRDAAETRLPPRERFDGSGHFFELPAIAAGLRDEREPVRGGHRQMTIYHKPPVTLVLFDFDTSRPGPGRATRFGTSEEPDASHGD